MKKRPPLFGIAVASVLIAVGTLTKLAFFNTNIILIGDTLLVIAMIILFIELLISKKKKSKRFKKNKKTLEKNNTLDLDMDS